MSSNAIDDAGPFSLSCDTNQTAEASVFDRKSPVRMGCVALAALRMRTMSGYVPATISYCTNCGIEVESGSRFCGNCGQALAPPRPPSFTPTAQSMPTPVAYSSTGGGLGNLFSASGRIGRLEYFFTSLAASFGAIVGWVLLTAFGGLTIGFLLGACFAICCGLVGVFAGIKRLHDFDQSGWLILLSFVPIASLILWLLLLFKGPSPGLNRFGYSGSGSPF